MDVDGLRSFFIYVIIFAALIGGGYWAFTTIDSGPEFSQKTTEQLAYEAKIEEEAAKVLAESEVPEPVLDETDIPTSMDEEITGEITEEVPTEISSEAAAIKTDLEDLLAKKLSIKPGDKGTFVLRIQKFLNYYNSDLNLKEDQDFGPSMRKAVESFQKDQSLNPDGGVGPKTISKMIEFLNK
ncbi:MAG: L-alanyl-D-glutamate peptidase [Candidatus Nomurabacteria bacterium GW2011_GWB1_37_5]|uniref:L-alanyl-D-glutamate peptidase n=1 Tax=Candidatus Nomurabacteria bacterium GW2011_GWB1_37_5 TaxID=1618742 RepID=A0A0G0H0M4_9BACT|nr:MAG: L-alanyl-D-glutamate peptidase [Candidatus Nomurabacteria bacterium GW2011_GWB1_37_5]